jgi:hypothetical protein
MEAWMKLVYSNSLAKTLDAVNEAYFSGEKLARDQKMEAAKFIASRHGQRYSYANTFAPTNKDFAEGINLFTGEKIGTGKPGASVMHILGEEACRALQLLNVTDNKVKQALAEATAGMQERLDQYTYRNGIYCCGKCSAALWRHAVVGDFRDTEKLLAAGMKGLKDRRDDKGRWRTFPFHYALSALADIDLPSARAEIVYAAPSIERFLRGKPKPDKYDKRRRIIAEKVLAKI